jgi:hypothetical protein
MTTNNAPAVRFTATPDEIAATRDNLMSGIATRADWERAHMPQDGRKAEGNILEALARHARAASKLDGMTLAFAARHGIDFVKEYNHQRVDGALMNEKAIPKTWEVMRVLNGASFAFDNEGHTTAATCLALEAQGKAKGAFSVAQHVNDTMRRWGHAATYNSGSTQSGSSLRAMAALGVVVKSGKDHAIAHDENFALMLKAAKAHNKTRSK